MSDFLSNLVARSRGEADTLQPRRRSLFEPSAARAEPLTTQLPADEVQAEPQLVSPAPQLQRSPESSLTAPAPPTPIPAKDVSAESSEPAATAASARRHEPSGTNSSRTPPPQVGQFDGRPEPADAAPKGIKPVVVPEPVDAPVDQPSAVAGDTISVPPGAPLPTAAVPSIVRPSSSLSPETQRAGTESIEVNNVERKDVSSKAERPLVPTLVPQFLPQPQPHEPPLSPGIKRTENSSPTIRVNIGRIEVRAVTAPTTAQQPRRPQPPRLSLDEYLRRRTGGGK